MGGNQTEPDLSPELVELRAIRALLEQLVSNRKHVCILPATAPDPADDVALVAGLDFLKDGETFHAQDLTKHGELFPAFKARLLAADIDNVADMGYWLRRHRGQVFNGRRLDVIDRDGDGTIWAFVKM